MCVLRALPPPAPAVDDATERLEELGSKYEHARAEGTRLRGRVVESEEAASEASLKLREAEKQCRYYTTAEPAMAIPFT